MKKCARIIITNTYPQGHVVALGDYYSLLRMVNERERYGKTAGLLWIKNE